MHLCLLDLVRMTGGQLRLASMPPREGELATLGKVVLSAAEVETGDVFWGLDCRACDLELAYLRGALGIVVSQRAIEPWPGRFCLVVEDCVAALARFVARLEEGREEVFGVKSPELKVLQLCAESRVDIYLPTCGQAAKEQLARRCRRRAA